MNKEVAYAIQALVALINSQTLSLSERKVVMDKIMKLVDKL